MVRGAFLGAPRVADQNERGLRVMLYLLRKLTDALRALERQRMIELRRLERTTLSALDDAISAPPT